MADITLYVDRFWISPYAFSAFVSLEEKGVAFEVREVSIGDGEHKQPEFAAHFITGRIPAIQHGDFGLAESSAIAEYIDECFDGPACVGKTNGVGLSRVRFEKAAEHSLVAVPGVMEGRRRASW